MIGRRIKSCRLMRGWSRKALAAKIGVKPQVITSYENGSDMPDLKTARLLASAFDMTLGKLMSCVPSRVRYEHNEFRKQASLTKSCQTAICMRAEEYFDKVILLSEILNDGVLGDIKAMYSLSLEQLVFRALAEEKITKSRAAELLEITLEQLQDKITASRNQKRLANKISD